MRGNEYDLVDDCGSAGFLCERAVRFCQHAGVYDSFNLRGRQYQYLAGGAAFRLSDQRDPCMAGTKLSEMEDMASAGSTGAGGKRTGDFVFKKCG